VEDASRLLQGASTGFTLGANMLSTKKAGVDRPSAWPNHGQAYSNCCQKSRNQGVIGLREENPQLDSANNDSGNWSP